MTEIPRPHGDGLLLVDKQSGITSHDAVDLVRRRTRIRKIGHTGTLDPLATGLLVLCVGKTTRLQAYLMKMDKTYEGTMQFGWATDTYDAEGRPVGDAVEKNAEGIDFEPLLDAFRGEIEQIPPRYSAKKIQGVRAYELARKGESPQLEPRSVSVSEILITGVAGSVAGFRVRCSAGTYVRSIVHELGQSTGLGAHLKTLRRTAIGEFDVNDAVATQAIREMTAEAILAPPHFRTMDQVDLPLERVLIDRTQEGRIAQGQSVIVKPRGETIRPKDLVSLNNVDQELVAIAEVVDVIREGGPVVLQPRLVLK